MLAEHQIEGRDAAFATELVHGTIRRQGTYDAIIGHVASKGLASIDPPVLDALRLGTHQLLNMRVPAHAAVSETVDLVRREIGHKPVHFANALLRKIGQKDLDGWLEVVTEGLEGDEARSVRTSHPLWIVTALREALGGHAAQIDKLLAADNAPPRVTLVARPGLCDPDDAARHHRASSRPTPASSTRAVTRGRYRRCATVGPASRTRGPSSSRSRLPRLRSTARTRVGSTSARGPAARPRCSVRMAKQRGAGLVANEVLEHRAELVRQGVRLLDNVEVTTADGRQRPVGARYVRPDPGRCAVHGARRAAAQARVAVASFRGGSRRPRPAAGGAADTRARARTTRGSRGLRDLLATRTRDARRRRRRHVRHATTSMWRPPSSGGPTSTAPMRCSARYYAAADTSTADLRGDR